MRRLADGVVAFEIADDDADGLRGEQRDPGKIGPRQARIGFGCFIGGLAIFPWSPRF
jgi:hypothetical protein